jgi:hypothetical protein
MATWSLRERPVWSLPATGPDALGQGHFEVQVDVLELGVPLDGARRDVRDEGVQALDEGRQLVLGDEPRAGKPAERARWSPQGRLRPARDPRRSTA